MKLYLRKQLFTGSVLLLTILLYCSILPAPVFAKSSPEHPTTLKAASELDYPPFAIVKPDGTAAGFSVDLLKAATEAVGLSVSFKIGAWNAIKQELADKKIDVLPLVSYSKERDKVYDFTAPYLRMNGTVFVRKGNNEIQDLSDLQDKEVLVMQGDTAHEYMVAKKLSKNITPTVSYDEAFTLLASGKHDAVVVQQIVGLQMIKKLHIANVVPVAQKAVSSLKPIALKLEGFEQKFCFAVPEGSQEVLSLLNEGLAIIYLDGTYNALYDKWFAPILPTPIVPLSTLIKQTLLMLVPLLFFFTLVGLWYLKRLVNKRTIHLEREIKQRQTIESELADANAKYVKAQEIGKVGNWEYNLSTQEFWGSTEAKRIYGFNMDSEAFTTEAVESCIPDRERVHQALVDLVERNVAYNLEFDIITRDTRQRRTILSLAELERDSSGNPIKIRGVVQDISVRRNVEKALRLNEAKYRHLYETMTQGVVIQDADGKIIEANMTACEILGLTMDQMLGKTPYDPRWKMIQADSTPYDPNELPSNIALRTGKPSKEAHCGIYVPEKDEYRWIIIGSAPRFKDGKTKPFSTMTVFTDITEHKKAEMKSETLQVQLLQAQKMEAIGNLAGGVAHDFNNMLSVILGYTELALESTELPSGVHDDLVEVLSAAKRSTEITRQLLAFARKQTIDPIVLDLNDTIEEMLKMVRRLIGEDIDLVWLPDAHLWSVNMDPSQLDQILVNLCVNARDAIKDVGKVTIETENISIDEKYCSEHIGSIPGDFILLAISDDGCGMTRETTEKIFEPFFTTKILGQGTGMGLSTVFGIVKQNAGFIYVYSEPGVGTTFKIYLPRHEGEFEETITKGGPTNLLAHGETVLVVEDEDSILQLCQRMLTELGYSVLTANSPEEAINIATKHEKEIHLLITDVIMPRMNGRILAEHLQPIYPALKILFMSGYTANVIAHHGVLEKGINFIPKPLSRQVLATKVREALEEKKR